MSDTAIRVENLGKAYKVFETRRDRFRHSFGLDKKKKKYIEFWALRNVSLAVSEGERVGLVGSNGAGKSTLLKMIAGSVPPTEGHIEIGGKIQALMELGTGFHPEFSGRENIRASLAYQGLKDAEIKAAEEEIIDFSELEEFIDRPFRTYSAGMQARLSFSVATARVPDILIVDEILGAGDAYFAGKSVERMRKITEGAGATVLFVSHDLAAVMQLCSRVVWIEKGEIVMDGDPLDVTKEYMKRVRERENLRLKKREKKNVDAVTSLLFRIIPADPDAAGISRFRKIRLLDDGEAAGEILPGRPMDNAEMQDSYLITREGQASWGDNGADQKGAFREFVSNRGSMRFAPFEFRNVPDLDLEKLHLEITADAADRLLIERYIAETDEYAPVTLLLPGEGGTVFPVFPAKEPELPAEEPKEDYEYGNRKIVIERVKILDEFGKDTRVLEPRRPMRVVYEYYAREPVENPVFVFCAYLPDGTCASQWFADSGVLGDYTCTGKGELVFSADELLMGEGSYVCSCGVSSGKIQKGGEEPESYHTIDRSLFFEVRQPLEKTEREGLVLQPYRVTKHDGLL